MGSLAGPPVPVPVEMVERGVGAIVRSWSDGSSRLLGGRAGGRKSTAPGRASASPDGGGFPHTREVQVHTLTPLPAAHRSREAKGCSRDGAGRGVGFLPSSGGPCCVELVQATRHCNLVPLLPPAPAPAPSTLCVCFGSGAAAFVPRRHAGGVPAPGGRAAQAWALSPADARQAASAARRQRCGRLCAAAGADRVRAHGSGAFRPRTLTHTHTHIRGGAGGEAPACPRHDIAPRDAYIGTATIWVGQPRLRRCSCAACGGCDTVCTPVAAASLAGHACCPAPTPVSPRPAWRDPHQHRPELWCIGVADQGGWVLAGGPRRCRPAAAHSRLELHARCARGLDPHHTCPPRLSRKPTRPTGRDMTGAPAAARWPPPT